MSGQHEAEQAVLGCILLGSQQTADVFDLLDPSDFLAPIHQEIFVALRSVFRAGQPIDIVTVAEAIVEHEGGVDKDYLFELQRMTPAISRIMNYTATVEKAARLRQFTLQVSELVHQAGQLGADPDAIHADLVAMASDARLLPRRVEMPRNVSDYGEVLDVYAEMMPPDEEDEWIIPGMLRRRWRALIIGGEGTGKSTILRTMQVGVANGFHPFAGPGLKIKPRVALMVDAENPIDVIADQLRLIDWRTHIPASRHPNARVWRVEEGIDLRRRMDQARLEEVVKATQPELICMGPLYKLHRTNDDWEQAALDVTGYLDQLRGRFGFALVIEHHKPNDGRNPLGSSVWKRWPEFGVDLVGDQADARGHYEVLKVKRFRGDRVMANWPTTLTRASSPAHQVPWEGTFERSVWNRQTPRSAAEPEEERF